MATKELMDASSAEPGQALNRFRELSTEFAETYPSRDEAFEFPRHEMNQLKASGLLAHAIPVEYGGMGASFYDIIESIRILAEGNPSIAQIYAVHAIILKHTGLWTENEKLKQWIFNEATQRNA